MVPAPALGRAIGAQVYLKLESELPTGSFKVRGALHALLWYSQDGTLAGVVTASTGNHGAGVAYAAARLGLSATIVLPENPNPVKRARIVEQGATVIERGSDLAEARKHAAHLARERNWQLITDGSDPHLTPGAAVIGTEILEQVPDTDLIIVPVGDTTLVRGVAQAARLVRPAVRMVGVQAEGAPAYFLAWQQGRAVSLSTCATVADGLATRIATEENARALRALVDEMVLVSDEEMLRAVRCLLLEEHVVAEPAGAAATAVLLRYAKAYTGRKVVLVVSGANLRAELLRRAAEARM